MKNRANEYELQKLNADFNKDLGRLGDGYRRKADEILYADRFGLDMQKRRNRLWAWFDRKTRYQIVPKIVIISFLLILGLFSVVILLGFRYDMDTFLSINLHGAFILLGLMLGGNLLVLLATLEELTGYRPCRNVTKDIVTNPAWKGLKCNVWHRETDE
ncbi:MAG: hypothetical protein ABSC19_15595 [Syntrophorhabdales bacterium]